MKSVWLQELTSDDVADYLLQDSTIIVPIGATETHGPHLPLGTDTYEAIDYSEEIAKRSGVLCAPPIWYGDSPHHMGRPGTISLRSETVIAVLKDVYRSLIHHGFKRIITFNGHRLANLPVIQIAAKQIKEEHPAVLFACFDPVVIAGDTHRRIRTAPGVTCHGGEFETSHMMLKHPELVHQEKFERSDKVLFRSPLVPVDMFAGGDKVLWTKSWQDQIKVAPRGHHGDPTAASLEKGQILWDAVVGNGAEFVATMREMKVS